jgi:putative transposase
MASNPERHTYDDYLRRLPREYYRGQAYVHWSLTIQDRRVGWLTPAFYYKFRELLTHATFRYGFTCPIYCCMPDHFHLMWLGLFDGTDQLNAMKFLRRQLNAVLSRVNFELQQQAYDNVLSESERERSAFETVCEYIARNPERKGLVPPDAFAQYKFTDCLIPGAPDVHLFADNYWDIFWRIYTSTIKNGLVKSYSP